LNTLIVENVEISHQELWLMYKRCPRVRLSVRF